MTSFANDDLGAMGSEHVSDEVQDLLQALFERLLQIIDTKLTARQAQIVKLLFLEGKTQTEVARMLGLCQPSVHKSLLGNLDYKQGGRRYGGAQKKLVKLCAVDEEIQRILKLLTEARREETE